MKVKGKTLLTKGENSFLQCGRQSSRLEGGIEDNSKITFLFLNGNICCDPSLEPSR